MKAAINTLRQSAFFNLRLRTFSQQQQYRRFSLQTAVIVTFLILLTSLGSILMVSNFDKQRQVARNTAVELFDQIAARTVSNVGNIYSPVETVVDMTTTLPLDKVELFSDGDTLMYFKTALDNNRHLNSLYVGFDNGNFFVMRPVSAKTAYKNGDFVTPVDSHYYVQYIDRNSADNIRYVTRYLDADLRLLHEENGFVTGYDPRKRDWFRQASVSDEIITTDFYQFFSSKAIGTTVARRSSRFKGVVAGDFTLFDLSLALSQSVLTPNSEIVVFTDDGSVLAYQDTNLLNQFLEEHGNRNRQIPLIREFNLPVLNSMYDQFATRGQQRELLLEQDGEDWIGSILPVFFGTNRSQATYLAILAPEDEVLMGLPRLRMQSLATSIAALVLMFLTSLLLAWRTTRSTRRLASETNSISQWEFETPVNIRSRITEIDQLATSISQMKAALSRFSKVAYAMSSKHDSRELGNTFLEEIEQVSKADYSALYFVSADNRFLTLVAERPLGDRPNYKHDSQDVRERYPAIFDLSVDSDDVNRLRHEITALRTGNIFSLDNTKSPIEVGSVNYATELYVPLNTRAGDTVGVLKLARGNPLGTDSKSRFSLNTIEVVKTLCVYAAMAMENYRLIRNQREMFESLVKLNATAIDAKSPHTGGHCQRVPVITSLLADAACASQSHPFKDFYLDESGRHTLYLASWLHDCGKITTPDHVAEKATKLETIYNRVHEVRMRFEVLWRDADIEYLQAISTLDSADKEQLQSAMQTRDARHQQLTEDFEFIAKCNIGSETMTDGDVQRITQIGSQTWSRHFDNRVGLSTREIELANQQITSLPAEEHLLANKQEHQIPHRNPPLTQQLANEHLAMQAPEYEYDVGELHSLTVRRGTLTREERYKINEHVVQSLMMLKSVPFPDELNRVVNIAANHHEKLDGSGFPRGLKARELAMEDRIMTIADIFEALTASDRPYKPGKTLRSALDIMEDMSRKGLICPDLLKLFVEKRVYQEYADKHLQPWQCDMSPEEAMLTS